MTVNDFLTIFEVIFRLVAEFLMSQPVIYFVALFIIVFCVYVIKSIIAFRSI